jgi:hypothetical protein
VTPGTLIAFTGRAGAGKSTAAYYLSEGRGFTRMRIAGPLKAMLRAIGLTDREIDGDLKERPCARLNGRTPRHAMQTLGTEWGRALIHPDFWIDLFVSDVRERLSFGESVVVDDLRFPNEEEVIRKLGGVIVHVYGLSGYHAVGAHESEAHVLGHDHSIVNEKVSLDAFYDRIDAVLEKIAEPVCS